LARQKRKLQPLWDKAQQENTIKSYKEYITNSQTNEINPFLNEANKRIREINGNIYAKKKAELTNLIGTQNPNNVSSISRLRCSITSIPESIDILTNLHTLSLHGNNITHLPKSIGSLSNLKTLDLSVNNLVSLPETIGNLSNLKYLYVAGNKLTSLPETIGMLSSLKYLTFGGSDLYYIWPGGGNDLTSLPETIGNLSNLKYLYVAGNNTNLKSKWPI